MDKAIDQSDNRTRAQIYSDRVDIRVAPDNAGIYIEALLLSNGVTFPGVTWDKVFPNWLIATDGNEVVGCVQVVPGFPMGYIEFLYTAPEANMKIRANAAKKLIKQATGILYANGCDISISTVDSINFKFYNIIEKYATLVSEGAVFLKRLKVN